MSPVEAGRDRRLPLREYQREALAALDAAWSGARRPTGKGAVKRPAVVLPTGMGKGHPLDTEVPTPDGLRLWGALAVGDRVFGSDGRPIAVTGVFDRGVLPLYRVTFRHGESVLVDGDHLWQVQRKGRKPQTVETRWLAEQSLRDGDGYRWATPVAEPVHHAGRMLPMAPYVVGALLANGGMTHSGTVLTTPDEQVVARVRKAVKAYRGTWRRLPEYEGRSCPAYSIGGVTQVTRDLGMRVHSRDKRIPRLFLETGIGHRIALLNGLLDGDGSSRTGGRRSVNYYTSSEGLADDVRELVTSLGGTCSIRRYDRGAKGVEYVCGILLPSDVPAFSTSRRDQVEKPAREFRPRRVIVSIDPAGEAPVRCISVDAPDNLYLITRAHIVTHNTVIFSHGIADAHATGVRPLVLVHREELAQQAKAKLHDVMPGADIGIVKADRNEIDADVIVGSVPTLARPSRREQLRNIGLVIADECHHAAAPSWRRVLEHFGCFEDDGKLGRGARAAGFTATMERGDGAHLGDVWQEIVFRRDILDGVRGGFLVNPVGRRVQIADLELDRVRKSRGDWAAGDLGDALTDADAASAIVEAYSEHARYSSDHPRAGRLRQGVIFAPTVQTAYDFADAMNSDGITCEVVEGDTPADERARIYDRFRTGETTVLSNCMVLTEGWDAPWAEVAVIARPTQSAALYVQMVGRVLRPWPEGGKRDALVLDVVGVTGMHSLATLAVLTSSPVDGVEDGESLAEAVERTRAKVEAGEWYLPPGERPEGMLVSAAVDLFAESTSVWLQTIATGRWFIPTRDSLYFLHEAPDGTWSVGRTPNKGAANVRATLLEAGLSMTAAMAWAESYASEEDPSISGRRSSWRKKPVTEYQRGMLATLGIPPEIVTGWRQGQVSDLIGKAVATMRLDFRTTDPRVLMGLDIPV